MEDCRRESHQGDADAYRDQPKQDLGYPFYSARRTAARAYKGARADLTVTVGTRQIGHAVYSPFHRTIAPMAGRWRAPHESPPVTGFLGLGGYPESRRVLHPRYNALPSRD